MLGGISPVSMAMIDLVMPRKDEEASVLPTLLLTEPIANGFFLLAKTFAKEFNSKQSNFCNMNHWLHQNI